MAEATFFRRPRQAPRTASMLPRRLGDYMPGRTIAAVRAMPVVVVGLGLLYAFVPKAHQADPSVAYVLVMAGLMTMFAVAVELTLRAIVARPQLVVSEDLLAADNAIRAASIHALSGAAMGLLFVGAGWMLFSVGTSTSVHALRWTLPWLGVLAFAGAVGGWIELGHPKKWRFRRGAAAGSQA